MTAPPNPGRYAAERRSALLATLEEAGLARGPATAWARGLSASMMRYAIDATASCVVEFDTAGFTPEDGVPYLEAGLTPKQALEATGVFGRTVADLRRLYAVAEEAVRIEFADGDYYVFDRIKVASEVATLMCSDIPADQAEALLRAGASASWAVWTHAECLRDSDPDRWSAEMFLVALGAVPDAPANPPPWRDQWHNDRLDDDHIRVDRPPPAETTPDETTRSEETTSERNHS